MLLLPIITNIEGIVSWISNLLPKMKLADSRLHCNLYDFQINRFLILQYCYFPHLNWGAPPCQRWRGSLGGWGVLWHPSPKDPQPSGNITLFMQCLLRHQPGGHVVGHLALLIVLGHDNSRTETKKARETKDSKLKCRWPSKPSPFELKTSEVMISHRTRVFLPKSVNRIITCWPAWRCGKQHGRLHINNKIPQYLLVS